MNESRKRSFITEKTNLDITAPGEYERLFTKVSRFEKRLGKDVCDWSSKEILTWLKLENKKSYIALRHYVSCLSGYTLWCMSHGLSKTNQNHYNEITASELQQCVNQVKLKQAVLSRDEVVQKIRTLDNYRDQFFILSLFEYGGIKNYYDDIINVRISDFTPTENTLYLSSSDRTVTVSDLLFDIASKAYDQEVYIGNMRSSPLSPRGDKVMKFVQRKVNQGLDISKSQMTFQLKRIIKITLDLMGYPNLTAKDIMISGMIWKIKEYAKYYQITPKEVIYDKDLYQKICNQFDMYVHFNQWWLRYRNVFEE